MIAVLLGSVPLKKDFDRDVVFPVVPDSNKLCIWELVLHVVTVTVQVLL